MLVMPGMNRMKLEPIRDRMKKTWDILSGYEAKLANFGTLRGLGRHRKTIEELKDGPLMMIHAVFKEREALQACLKEIKEKDLGISVSVSGLYEEFKESCSEIGLSPHTVQVSFGMSGKKDKLPAEDVLEVSTMCGHAMVSPYLIAHLIGKIDKGKMTHMEAAEELTAMCVCGIFNPHRAENLLKKMTQN
jgi:hypothetical protein